MDINEKLRSLTPEQANKMCIRDSVYAGPFVHMTQQDADDMAQAQNRYDINTRLAINQYIRCLLYTSRCV